MGAAGRQAVVDRWSLDGMVRGYQELISGLYRRKTTPSRPPVSRLARLFFAPLKGPIARPNG
jgi:hypothetical protein